jgi:hypothetical protein
MRVLVSIATSNLHIHSNQIDLLKYTSLYLTPDLQDLFSELSILTSRPD